MRVLFAVLNWGMGHASRSVPIIRNLQAQGHEVVLASDGVALDLLQAEFPDVPSIELPGYNVHYPTKNIYVNVLLSTWAILRAIRAERRWLRQYLRDNPFIDRIFSDNRYGIRNSKIPSILITHQLKLFGKWPLANRLGEWYIHKQIDHFTAVWVPDWDGIHSLTGGMADRRDIKIPVRYIGPLSRFPASHHILNRPDADVDILAVLSGPEPQRQYFETAVLQQLSGIPGHHVLIRGTKSPYSSQHSPSHIKIYDILPAEELFKYIIRSKMQVSRSGYSTVMDLVYSGIPALMVPTPGQFEQEFLTQWLAGKGPWIFQTQDRLDLQSAFAIACDPDFLTNSTRIPIPDIDLLLMNEGFNTQHNS